MADFYPLLQKAIGNLDRPDAPARQQLYDRAREALIRQLREAGMPRAQIDEQLAALKVAVLRIERDFAELRERHAPPPVPKPEPAPAAEPRDEPVAPVAAASPRRGWKLAAAALVVLALMLGAGYATYRFGLPDRKAAPVAQSAAPRPRADTPAPRPATASQPTTAARPAALSQPDTADADGISYILRRQHTFYRTSYPAGTVVIALGQKFLYLVMPKQLAIRYAIGIGRECESSGGMFQITAKAEQPRAGTAAAAAPGTVKRFDPPAVYFGSGQAVHAARDPADVGERGLAKGCFLSWTEDIADLVERVRLDDRVVVAN